MTQPHTSSSILGLPPRPPAAPATQLARWSLMAISAAAVLAVVLIAGLVVLIKQNPRDQEAPASPPPSPDLVEIPAPNPPPAPHPPKIVPPVTPRVVTRASNPVVPPPRPPEPGPKPAAPPPRPSVPSSAEGPLREAVGVLLATHLYQTYLNIGLLADLTEGESLERADAGRTLDTVMRLVDTVEQQVQRLGEKGLGAEDRTTLEKTRAVVARLRAQARELRAYWTTGEKVYVGRFHKAREQAWAGIKELLHLPD